MEFFQIAKTSISPEMLVQKITLESLPLFCEAFLAIQQRTEDMCDADTIWGNFPVDRREINNGVRFTMPTCPNALSWTVTTGYPPAPDDVVIHVTINRTEHDPDFIETLVEFAESWKAGLENAWADRKTAPQPDNKKSPKPLTGLNVLSI